MSRTAYTHLRAWALAAIAALAVAGLYAPILALSRLPGIEGLISWPLHAFEKGIITHVVFSIVVWYLAVFGALIHVALSSDVQGRRNRIAERIALYLIGAAFILLLIPSLMDRGEPSLNNYVPTIIDPLYYIGLMALFISLTVQSLCLLINKKQVGSGHSTLPLKMVAVAYLAAMVAFTFSWAAMGDVPLSQAFNEDLFWAGGHILQFVNAGLMLAGMSMLSGGRILTRLAAAPFVLIGVGAVVALGLFAVTDLADGSQRIGFTDLKYLLAVPVVLFALDVFRRRAEWLKADFSTYVIALTTMTFATGGIFGFFVDGADTRTPAHYHGVLGGVNLVFFALFFTLILPKLGRPVRICRKVYALIGLYAVGQTLQCVGLFMAGGYGTPRKTAGDAQGLEEIGAILGMTLNGVGALIAIIGGIMFVFITGHALLKRNP